MATRGGPVFRNTGSLENEVVDSLTYQVTEC